MLADILASETEIKEETPQFLSQDYITENECDCTTINTRLTTFKQTEDTQAGCISKICVFLKKKLS
jgi:hypothetical protein